MSHPPQYDTKWQGKFIAVRQVGSWEYVTRTVQQSAVAILAITQDQRVVLVEQYRPPVGHRVVEIPAGLAGDIQGQEDEALLVAAQRELREETGYIASEWTELCGTYSSPGLTDERIVLFLAQGLNRVEAGGGDPSEEIVVHEVPLEEVFQWLRERNADPDIKLLAALQAAGAYLKP